MIGIAAYNIAKKDKERQYSDRRLKVDITTLAQLDSGINLYRFKYRWDATEHVGVLAQEIIADPRYSFAVTPDPNGLLIVDYAKLGLKLTTYEAWKAQGLAAARLDAEVMR